MEESDLSIVFGKWCNCGDTEVAYEALMIVMEQYLKYQREEIEWEVRDDAIYNKIGRYARHLALYDLNSMGLMEHGSSIYSSWLTPKGEMVFELLTKELKGSAGAPINQ